MKKLIEQHKELEKKIAKKFIESIKLNKYDFVRWDLYRMEFDFGEYTLSLWIANEDYGLKIESPFFCSFSEKQRNELYDLVKIVKLTNKAIKFNRYSNDLYWKYTCICGQELSWTGYDDDNWWTNVSPKHEKKICECGLTWKVNLKCNLASVLYKDYIKKINKDQIEIEVKKREEYEKAKAIVDSYKL